MWSGTRARVSVSRVFHSCCTAVTLNADPIGIGAEIRGIRMNPLKGGKAVIHRGRKFVLRPHAVIDRSDHRPGPAAEVAGDEIVRIETPDDVAAAMKIDDGRHWRCRLKQPVEP